MHGFTINRLSALPGGSSFASCQESQHVTCEDLREDDRVMVAVGNHLHAAALEEALHMLGLFL
jgi:hypothetical protein